ncbi:hypothetical protein C8R46DRAFT_1106367 [Mycena filopes]|nr:hypothetical protein C8R46DRAFT_1106367 [Mycena filopes]
MQEYGSVDYISGWNESFGRFYFLKQSTPTGDELIVIQASPLILSRSFSSTEYRRILLSLLSVVQSHTEITLPSDAEREGYNFGLEIIQSLLHTINFGATKWAYLVGSDNNYRIVPRVPPLALITEVPWCPLVDERDIKITRLLCAENQEGIWDGMQVDIFMAMDTSLYLERMMAGYRLLRERNLEHFAYPAVGHVVRNGTTRICGLMTEPAYGRMIEKKDRAAVGCNSPFPRSRTAGLVFTTLHLSTVMITDDGQVHFLMDSIGGFHRQAADPAVRAEDRDEFHWRRLELLFKEVEHGNIYLPPRKQQPLRTHLPHFLPPAHGPILSLWGAIELVHLSYSEEYVEEGQAEGSSKAVGRRGRVRTEKKRTLQSVEVVFFDDEPISARSLPAPRVRMTVRPPGPYQKPDKLLQELLRVQDWHRRKQLGQ